MWAHAHKTKNAPLNFFGPNRPRNEKNPPEKIMHGAVKFIGALIVIRESSEKSTAVNLSAASIENYQMFWGGGGQTRGTIPLEQWQRKVLTLLGTTLLYLTFSPALQNNNQLMVQKFAEHFQQQQHFAIHREI